jgi:NTP pyrophosphatase (non-canonical NTP hydrolase)
MEISALQQIVKDRYFKSDSERGLFHTALWFHEEVGELSSAIASGDKENAREEFADVLMWLMTLANLMGVDMEEVVDQYLVNHRKKLPTK